MTRVNVSVSPSELPDKLLLSEHREITRIPNAVKSGRARLDRGKIPERFTLGEGHVRFFYDKLKYLRHRYTTLLAECKARGFDVTDKSSAFDGIDDLPNQRDALVIYGHERDLIIKRIESKGYSLLTYMDMSVT